MPSPPPLQLRQQVAAKPGKLAGADPFDRLVVIGIHDDGTYHIARLADTDYEWRRVHRRHLIPLAD